MVHTRANRGVCSRSTTVVIENGIVKEIEVIGGCSGNIKGLSALIKDMDAKEAIRRLKGTRCGPRNSSCPDQIALALEEALAKGE